MKTVTGTPGEDRLIYSLTDAVDGVNMSVSGSLATGYNGVVHMRYNPDTPFTGIENFSFETGGAADSIATGAGDDVAFLGGGHDRADLGDGNDMAAGGHQHDVLLGRGGSDHLEGNAGNDRLYGGTGDDILEGGWGNDGLFAGAGNDFIVAGPGNNTIWAGDGDDFVIAGEGDDVINLGDGDDFVELSHTGASDVDGGLGADTAFTFFTDVPWNNDYALNYEMLNYTQTITDGSGGTVTSTIVRISNFGVGGHVDARIIGAQGDNELSSDTGNDLLSGWGGNDSLYAGSGQDTLYGGWGNDTLDGGWGGDVLSGGFGQDTFVFNGGWDRILDFDDDTDTIQIASGLVTEGTTVDDILADMTEVQGGDTVIDLGGTAVLRLVGFTDVSALADDMVIV